jgi:polyisoprenyl-phosphate glycosyltransferase
MPDNTETMPPVLTIVSPCYNECEIIGDFIRRLTRIADELAADCEMRILIVDDGSRDGSADVLREWSARDTRVSWLGLARNFGHQAALSAGIDHVVAGAVLTMDSDLEHPPETIPAMVRHWLVGSEVVCAVREAPEGLSVFKSASSNLFYTVFNFLSETKLHPGAADFVLMSEKVRVNLQQMPERHRFLRAMVAWTGFSRTLVSYKQPVRPAGRSKYTTGRMLRLAMHGVLSFSVRPVYWMFAASLALVSAGLLYLIYVLWVRFVLGEAVAGWASVIGVLLVIGGWQTLVCSVVGLYVAKIFEQVKGRPNYVIRHHPADRDK